MRTRTIYVKDTQTWEQASEYAKSLKLSMSEFILMALRYYLIEKGIVK